MHHTVANFCLKTKHFFTSYSTIDFGNILYVDVEKSVGKEYKPREFAPKAPSGPKPEEGFETRYQCPHCDSNFSEKRFLYSHVRMGHKEQFLTTDFTNIAYTVSKLAEQTGDLPTKEPIKRESNEIQVGTTAPTENTDQGFKPFSCNYCGVRLLLITDLIEHMKTHTDEPKEQEKVVGK